MNFDDYLEQRYLQTLSPNEFRVMKTVCTENLPLCNNY